MLAIILAATVATLPIQPPANPAWSAGWEAHYRLVCEQRPTPELSDGSRDDPQFQAGWDAMEEDFLSHVTEGTQAEAQRFCDEVHP